MNQVRIIGGKWKGRKLRFPDRAQLRPSLGRMRETLFNWLAGQIEGRRCLDLYAGSGVLGLEALSRGAASATLVDKDPAVIASLKRSCFELCADEATVIKASAASWLVRQDQAWDLIFLDPPFVALRSNGPRKMPKPDQERAGQPGTSELEKVLLLLLRQALVHDASLVYVEHSAGNAPDLSGWRMLKHSKVGDTEALLLQPDVV